MQNDLALCIVWYIFRTLSIIVNLEHCVTVPYSESCHIQNPDISRTRVVFRTLSSHTLAYLKRCVRLANLELCLFQGSRYIQNPVLFRYIQAYSGIFNNENYNKLQWRHFNNAWLSLLKVLCYPEFLKNTKYVRIILNHF